MYRDAQSAKSSYGGAGPVPSPQEGISSVLPRVTNRVHELAGMVNNIRRAVMPIPEKETGLAGGRIGLVGQLQDIEDVLATASADASWILEHFNT